MSKRNLVLLIVAVFLVLGLISLYLPQKGGQTSTQKVSKDQTKDVPRLETVAQNLQVPWALVFLPDKSILFTERVGRVRLVDKKNNLNLTPIAVIEDVLHEGEGGLMGITIHPDFSKNHFVYLYYTYANNNGQTLNRVVRFKFEDNALSDKAIIVDAIPGALFHNGGRIKFGPDEFLYITTGDSQNPSLSQNKNSKAGKILRVTEDGKPAPNNSFKNEIYSYGHRNPQGLSWDEDGKLWATEHGQSATDELNLIEMGGNYGWPARLASESVAGRPAIEQSGMVSPKLQSGQDTWAPAGLAYVKELNALFFAGLRGQTLYDVRLNQTPLILKEHLKGEFGRIRDVVLGPDNLLYITTSNRDGRGNPSLDDDKILRVNPTKL